MRSDQKKMMTTKITEILYGCVEGKRFPSVSNTMLLLFGLYSFVRETRSLLSKDDLIFVRNRVVNSVFW